MEILSNDNCTVEMKRGRGGQPGNQNARKHGFYSKTLDEQGKKDYEDAKSVMGLEDEIALIRAKIMGILRNDPNNMRVLNEALATLCRLFETHRHIAKGDKAGMMQAVGEAFKNLAPWAFGALMGKFGGS
jgi:hypothetical protein